MRGRHPRISLPLQYTVERRVTNYKRVVAMMIIAALLGLQTQMPRMKDPCRHRVLC